jgi:hypothetical protein
VTNFTSFFDKMTRRRGLSCVWVPLHDDGKPPLICVWIDSAIAGFEAERCQGDTDEISAEGGCKANTLLNGPNQARGEFHGADPQQNFSNRPSDRPGRLLRLGRCGRQDYRNCKGSIELSCTRRDGCGGKRHDRNEARIPFRFFRLANTNST